MLNLDTMDIHILNTKPVGEKFRDEELRKLKDLLQDAMNPVLELYRIGVAHEYSEYFNYGDFVLWTDDFNCLTIEDIIGEIKERINEGYPAPEEDVAYSRVINLIGSEGHVISVKGRELTAKNIKLPPETARYIVIMRDMTVSQDKLSVDDVHFYVVGPESLVNLPLDKITSETNVFSDGAV